MSIDLSQFHQVFYEESFEGLDVMESSLMQLNTAAPDAETINTIFRAAHSIKGGSATFGFSRVADFTHVLETLLDEVRAGQRGISRDEVDLLLQAVDCLREILTGLQAGAAPAPTTAADLRRQFEAILAAPPAIAPDATAPDMTAPDAPLAVAPDPDTDAAVTATTDSTANSTINSTINSTANSTATANGGYWRIRFRPHGDMLCRGNEPLRLFRELAGLGELTIAADLAQVPAFAALSPEQCFVGWELLLAGTVSRAQIDEVFEWVIDEAELSIDYCTTATDRGAGVSAASTAPAGWSIQLIPGPTILQTGNEPLRLFRELAELGQLQVTCDGAGLLPWREMAPELCYLRWQLTLLGAAITRAQIADIFEWIADESEIQIEPLSLPAASVAPGLSAAMPAPVARDCAAAPVNSLVNASVNTPAKGVALGVANSPANPRVTSPAADSAAISSPGSSVSAPAKPATAAEPGSIRVGIDKIDNLINMVGELVITQSMLGQLGTDFSLERLPKLIEGLNQLEQNTRELQESVMRIRMLPISFAFSRFPRMVRDLSKRLDKSIRLELRGEQTELDKTVMEKIGDPLVHLVRNAVDHGIETPAERLAAGKSAEGLIVLNAYHQGGNVVIEIDDDGKGLNRDKIVKKALEKQLINDADVAAMTDEQIFDLIFAPGFSTAEKVSDVSGRGVGMDVVRRNIQELNGAVEIRSREGQGSRIIIRLPLTLAILDGQLVRVGTHTYIFPLVAIVESLQLNPDFINRVAGGYDVFQLRDDYVPIIRLYEIFDIVPASKVLDESLLVVVDCDGEKVGIVVDDLLAQQQVVIKSLEQNYRRVEGVSGATILGDGRVALILDIPGLVKLASDRHRLHARVINLSQAFQPPAAQSAAEH